MRIYVGNLSYETTEETLTELFTEWGEVSSSTILTERQTGRSRGFGFIEMSNDEEARKAIEEANGRDCEGRTLTVNEAKPRAERGGGGGGGGYHN